MRTWLMLFFVLLAVVSDEVPVHAATSFTDHEKDLYYSRHFIELLHELNLSGKFKLALLLEEQSEDLAGCRSVSHGKDSVPAYLKCVRFLERELQLNLHNSAGHSLVENMNFLCSTFQERQRVEELIKSGIFSSKAARWRPCRRHLWREIYQFALVDLDDNPAKALSLVNLAGHHLASEPEAKKVLDLFTVRSSDSPKTSH